MFYPCKSGWNLPTSSWDMVQTSMFGLKFGSLSPAVTLKIRSRSPKPNELFIMSQCYIHANLIKIHPPVHEISCKRERVTVTLTPTLTPTPTGSAPKIICPLPFCGGGGVHNKATVAHLSPICQGQISFQKTYKWAMETRGLKSNLSELLCLSWLPGTLTMIRSKMNELAWMHHFPIISLWECFKTSRAANSIVSGPIWPKFELVWDLMHILVTCKY